MGLIKRKKAEKKLRFFLSSACCIICDMDTIYTAARERRQAVLKKKTGIMGGTFNPPHIGHLFMAEQAFYEFGLDRVMLMPLGDPPHKRDIELLPAPMRLAMLETMTENAPFLSVSDIELKRSGYTYTVDTLNELKRENDDDYYYIIGADTLFELHHWREFEKVMHMTEFICFMRRGIDRREVAAQIKLMRDEYGKRVLLSGAVVPDISSTEIRARIKEGLSIKGMVTEKVRGILEANNAFR